MNTSQNKYDALEQLIIDEVLSIVSLDFHVELDLMLIVLNTKAVLRQKISSFKNLRNANIEALKNYELIGEGRGIHWPLLDEDLSLKGFLQQEIRNLVVSKDVAA